MTYQVKCVCGKPYPWKRERAVKRARCSCGNIISFPVQMEPVEQDAAIDWEAVEASGQLSVPTPITPPARSSPVKMPAMTRVATGSEGPPLLTKLGVLAAGLAALGFFAIWPMAQVLRGEASIQISFKGIILGAMMTMVGLNLTLLGNKGIPWKKTPDQALTSMQKVVVLVTVVAAMVLCGLIWLFFNQHGYEVKF
jgi:hypothetical protein